MDSGNVFKLTKLSVAELIWRRWQIIERLWALAEWSWWVRTEVLKKNLSQLYFLYQKSQVDWPELDSRSPWFLSQDYPVEISCRNYKWTVYSL